MGEQIAATQDDLKALWARRSFSSYHWVFDPAARQWRRAEDLQLGPQPPASRFERLFFDTGFHIVFVAFQVGLVLLALLAVVKLVKCFWYL